MLLRVYRLTDKVGTVFIKLGAATADWLLEGMASFVNIARRSTSGIFGLIFALLLGIANGLWWILKGVGRILSPIFSRFGIETSRAVQSSARAGGIAVSDAMARRAARDEIDVVIKEDPLRIQNRRLSFLVLVLGVIVIGALLYATDPSRFNQAIPIAVVPDNNDNLVVPATAESNNTFVESSTAIPTAAPLPEALRARGAIAFTVRERGQTDIWALQVGSGSPLRLTNKIADERDPEWSPQTGTRLAYASHENGNWDVFVYDSLQNASSPLTLDLSFQGNPSWSPDELWLAYESYITGNLDIFAAPIDGSSNPLNLTENPAPDFSPAWSPGEGRRVAFVSLRDGNQEIYVLNLNGDSLTNITNSPLLNEDYPVWSPDGNFIAFSAWEQGSEKVFIVPSDGSSAPQLLAIGRSPTWSPDGSSIAFVVDTLDGSRTDLYAVTTGGGNIPVLISSLFAGATAPSWTSQPLPPQLVNSGGLELAAPALFTEQIDSQSNGLVALKSLANVQTNNALLSDAVDDSFGALRQRVFDESGRDYLNVLDDAFWVLDHLPDLGEPRPLWYKSGRAFSIQRNGIRGLPPPIEIVRENIGTEVYWRIFVRVDDAFQRGQLGEPLRRLPWDFLSADSRSNVDAFNQGGSFRDSVQGGYYIDFTQIAADYGWERRPASSDWVANYLGRNYWLFVNDGGLSWCQAMLQQYNEGALVNFSECSQ
jgi:TolB protein